MLTKEDIYTDLQNLVSKAFTYAGSVDLGEDRIAAFELAEALHRLQRIGAPGVLLAATNPFNFSDDTDDWGEEDDE